MIFHYSLDDLLYAVNGPGVATVQGFTIDPSSAKILVTWSPQNKVGYGERMAERFLYK